MRDKKITRKYVNDVKDVKEALKGVDFKGKKAKKPFLERYRLLFSIGFIGTAIFQAICFPKDLLWYQLQGTLLAVILFIWTIVLFIKNKKKKRG